jgi:hypothetical protein
VIFPGFLSSAPAYTSVTQHLQELGYATSKDLGPTWLIHTWALADI